MPARVTPSAGGAARAASGRAASRRVRAPRAGRRRRARPRPTGWSRRARPDAVGADASTGTPPLLAPGTAIGLALVRRSDGAGGSSGAASSSGDAQSPDGSRCPTASRIRDDVARRVPEDVGGPHPQVPPAEPLELLGAQPVAVAGGAHGGVLRPVRLDGQHAAGPDAPGPRRRGRPGRRTPRRPRGRRARGRAAAGPGPRAPPRRASAPVRREAAPRGRPSAGRRGADPGVAQSAGTLLAMPRGGRVTVRAGPGTSPEAVAAPWARRARSRPRPPREGPPAAYARKSRSMRAPRALSRAGSRSPAAIDETTVIDRRARVIATLRRRSPPSMLSGPNRCSTRPCGVLP